MRIIGTLHNRRGDPLLLLKFLRILRRDENASSLGVAWSVPSGNVEPSWEELAQEEERIQETLRDCVRMVHGSSVTWEAKSFLGRCYRSFQYEFMVSLNLKRHDPDLRLLLVDDPSVRELRYKEIGRPKQFLAELESLPKEDQAGVLRSRYEKFRTAYENMETYQRMIDNPDSALFEISREMIRNRSRENYIMEHIEGVSPDIVLLRLVHCLTDVPLSLKKDLGLSELYLANKLASMGTTMRLSEAERMVGPLPARD